MAVQTITYQNKVALNENPNVADINKVKDSDMNEIKSVVNNNANELNSAIESGSNENGNYTKYADGTMICTKQVTVTTRIDRAFGSLYETSSVIEFGDYAEVFISVPLVFTYCISRTGIPEAMQQTTETNWGKTWLMRPIADTSDQSYTINLLAIGKWK